ncbi:MAG: FAD-binding oxidoreductase [Candidatus Limnocylindrales bacterium]
MDAANATLVARVDLTATVARFLVAWDEGRPDFRPGQYLALGLLDGDRILQRPYSTASTAPTASGADRGGPLEFLIRRVEGGALTPRLWAVAPGDRVRIGRPKGLFTLLPEDPRTHLFVATGTGIAPFISMLEALLGGPRPPRVLVVHGVSRPDELGYRERLEAWAARRPGIGYRPTISRPAEGGSAGWSGLTGRAEAVLDRVCDEAALDPRDSVAYLCGNPEMIVSAGRILATRGFPAAAIRSEQYWPAAPAPNRAAA